MTFKHQQRYLSRTLIALPGLCVALAALLTSCSDSPKKTASLDIASLPEADTDDWLEQQHLIRYQVVHADGHTSTGTTNVGGMDHHVRYHCTNAVSETSVDSCYASFATNLCTAKTYLALATPQSDPIVLRPELGFDTIVFDRITEANAADLAGMAFEYGRRGIDYALERLNDPSSHCKNSTTGAWYANPRSGRSWALDHAAAVANGYHLVRAAYERAIEATLNTSDAARSTSASAQIAAQRSIYAPTLSRAAAAHLLVGGDNGILGSTEKGYCLAEKLTPQAQTALKLLRDAGPPPSLLTSSNIQTILNTDANSVRKQLGGLYKLSALQDSPGSMQSVETYYNLDERDFLQALEYLKQEISVFARSHDAKLPAVNGVRRAAGSAGDRVADLPDGAWSARGRYTANVTSYWYDTASAVFPVYPRSYLSYVIGEPHSPLSTFIAGTHAAILNLLRTSTDHFSTASTTLPSAESKEVLGVLSSIIATNEYKGALVYSASAAQVTFKASAHGYTDADKVRVVVGEDGLRCAATGNIEGAPCSDALTGAQWNNNNPTCTTNPATLSCLTLMTLTGDTSAPGAYGTLSYTGSTTAGRSVYLGDLVANKTRLYFVKPKTLGGSQRPGDFELLGGGTLLAGATQAIPVVPSLDRRVAEVLTPNKKNCAVAETTCLGKSFDERLPLEDELSDDNDGVESSWKHYLALARQAADESDLLAKEFRDAKLNQLGTQATAEQRKEDRLQAAESAFQAVQAQCGTEIDGRKLVEALSNSTIEPNLDLHVEATSGSCPGVPCSANSDCVVGRCIRKQSRALFTLTGETDQARRLEACLDTSIAAVAPFATLGDKPLCVYVDALNEICPSTLTPGTQCPAIKTGTCVAPAMPTGLTAKEVEPLGYFEDNGPPPSDSACTLFRRLRRLHSADDMQRMIATNVFHPFRFSPRMGTIAFEAVYGGYFTISENGVPRYTSGDVTVGAATAGWPATAPAACATTEAGLFCTTTSASDPQRGAFVARVFKAALGAAAIQRASFDDKKGLKVTYPHIADGTKFGENKCLLELGAQEGIIFTAAPASSPIRTCREQLYALSLDNPDSSITTYRWLSGGSSPAWVRPDNSTLHNTATFNFVDDFYVYAPQLQLHVDDIFKGLSTTGSSRAFTRNPFVQRALLGEESEGARVALTVDPQTESNLSHLLGNLNSSREIDSLAIMDGLELLCELDANHAAADGSVPPPTFAQMSDVEQAGAYVEQLGRMLTTKARGMLFASIPRLASEALGDVGPTGSFPASSGEMGQAISGLRASLISTRQLVHVIGDTAVQMGAEMQTLKAQLEINEASKEIVNLNTMSAGIETVSQCMSSLLSTDNLFDFGASFATSCVAGMAQFAITMEKASLEASIDDLQLQQVRAAFAGRMSTLATNLQKAGLDIETSREAINSSLQRIDGLRRQARVAFSRAVYLASYQSEKQLEYDEAVGTIANLTQRRYITALENAKLMSFLARRAIEQRLGIRLNEMRDPLPLVDPPATWEGSVCARGAAGVSRESETDEIIAIYGDGFIGDYVTNLENLVESYRLTNNFHEGSDVAVVSLRDDVANVRVPCLKPSTNLLKESAKLDGSVWGARHCTPVTLGGVTYPTLNCIAAQPLSPTEVAVPGLTGAQQGARAYYLQFGDGKTCSAGLQGGCGWQVGSTWGQLVTLQPARYRLSWYSKDPQNATINGAAEYKNASQLWSQQSPLGIATVLPTGTLPTPLFKMSPDAGFLSPFVYPQAGSYAVWKRASIEFAIAKAGEYEVGFGINVPGSVRPTYQVTIAAPMLEAIRNSGAASLMPAFQATDAEGAARFNDCEDREGNEFRASYWRRECMRNCKTGYSTNCKNGPEECYREFTFGVAQPWLQSGKLFNFSGFAKGNYNYRIESLALNFVGSAVRDCSLSSTPSTCYNAGFVPYSVEHNGPFFIRTHDGGDFEALVFDGRIEHARGLALERYLTNPLASTDRELLTDYFRREFAGRPLDGNFVVRVWEEPGVNFDAIEDVQLVMNYRYWTRNE